MSDQLPKLIQQAYNSLSDIKLKSAAPSRPEPAMAVKKSVRSDRIICLDRGKQFSMRKHHLRADHQLTPQEYRQRWGLRPTYPMVASAYVKVRSALAKKNGLGRTDRAESQQPGAGCLPADPYAAGDLRRLAVTPLLWPTSPLSQFLQLFAISLSLDRVYVPHSRWERIRRLDVVVQAHHSDP
jgi:predicted transcriptional regulator